MKQPHKTHECPHCHRQVGTYPDSTLMRHKADGVWCDGSRYYERSFDEAR